MKTLAELWKPSPDGPPKFEPVARYFAPMDCLIYLREDCTYRAVRLNAFTTILLHPYEDRPVGVKLKGMRFLHERLKAILLAVGAPQAKLGGVHLIAYWEVALTGMADREIRKASNEWQRQMALRTRKEIVEDAGLVLDAELQAELKKELVAA